MNDTTQVFSTPELRAALLGLQARSGAVTAVQLRGLEGLYRWADASGAYMFDLQVDGGGLRWSAEAPAQGCDVEVLVKPAELAKLVGKRTDPLNIFTSGGARLRCTDGRDAQAARERVQKLLNLLCNAVHMDDEAKQALERWSLHASDFTACERVADEAALVPRLARGCPVIVEQACGHWPLAGMSPQQISAMLGDTEIGLLLSEYGFGDGQAARYGKSSFAHYVAGLYGQGVAGYMAANAVPPALDGTYLYPSVFPREAFNAPRWWVGPKGAGLKLHRDLVDNFLYQVKGAKRIDLYAPSESRWLYPAAIGGNPLYEPSRVDPEQVDAERFPDFARARHLTVHLAAGEMLYLPAGWWHRVVNKDVSWSLNFFAVNRLPHVIGLHASTATPSSRSS
jgi:hypothetical protein